MVKRALAWVSPPQRATGCRVLLYHAVGEPSAEDRLGLRVSPRRFREQMAWLQEHGYRVVPLTSLLDGGTEPGARTVAITFDDGYASQLEAAEVLEELGFPATFFVVPSFLDASTPPHPARWVRGRSAFRPAAGAAYWERWGYFGWRQLAELAARGFEIGAHSATHVPLTRCASGTLEVEVAGAKARLEQELGRAVESFSYPHGAFNGRVVRAVEAAGYHAACTSLYGANRLPLARFALRRIEVTGEDRLADFARKLQGRYDWLAGWQRWRMSHA